MDQRHNRPGAVLLLLVGRAAHHAALCRASRRAVQRREAELPTAAAEGRCVHCQRCTDPARTPRTRCPAAHTAPCQHKHPAPPLPACRGYLLTQVLGGVWADKYGAKRVLGFGVVWWSLATMLTPVAAQISLPLLLVVRACMGVGEGVAMPAMNNLLSK